MGKLLGVLFVTLGLSSFLSGLILLTRYWWTKTLRKPPGMLVLWQCLAQTLLDLLWTLPTLVQWATR